MKSLLEHSCELISGELRNLVYVYELKDEASRKKIRNKKMDVSFEIKELPSRKTPGINQLHLVCFVRDYPATYMYLAEIDPTTRQWCIENSSFIDKTKKFVTHCLEILESRNPQNAIESGNMLVAIADSEFKKLSF